jgi:nicotinamidase-related amidase
VSGRLIEASGSLLVVVDVQEGFLARVEAERQAGFLERIAFLVESAAFAGVPRIATVESPDDWGGLHPALVPALAGDPVLPKAVFGLADDPGVFPAVVASGRRTIVLTGMETDVCVAQSALGLLDRGYRVVVVEDAVASPGTAHAFGLRRIERAGAELVCAKQLHYEWVRTVEASRRFHREHPGHVDPPGVLL